MNDQSHGTVVAQRQQLFSRCVPWIPSAQGSSGFVGEHDVILRMIEDRLCLVLLFTCEKQYISITWLRALSRILISTRHTRTPNTFRVCLNVFYRLLPVVPAPVYAIKHLLVDNSHNFIKESFPEDSKYCNSKLQRLFSNYSVIAFETTNTLSVNNLLCNFTCM